MNMTHDQIIGLYLAGQRHGAARVANIVKSASVGNTPEDALAMAVRIVQQDEIAALPAGERQAIIDLARDC